MDNQQDYVEALLRNSSLPGAECAGLAEEIHRYYTGDVLPSSDVPDHPEFPDESFRPVRMSGGPVTNLSECGGARGEEGLTS